MPVARLAAHDEQMTAGAQMEQYGGWLRAAWYRKGDETEEAAVRREVLTVRNSVGLFDASPLGKIEVKGPDRSEEHTSELQSLMRISYAVFCLKKNKYKRTYYKQYRTP